MPWSNQRAHQAISEKLLSKEFHCGTTDHKQILKIVFIEKIKIVLQISDEISVLLIAALGSKLNLLWH